MRRSMLVMVLVLSAAFLGGCTSTDNANGAAGKTGNAANVSNTSNTTVANSNTPAGTATGTPRAAAAEKNGWWVRVCTSKTEASGIDLWIGLGGNSGTHRQWRKWSSNDPAEFDVPAEFRTVQEIWIKGIAEPRDRNVHMCTYYRDHSTQKMTFDNDEEHETSQGDNDDCDC